MRQPSHTQLRGARTPTVSKLRIRVHSRRSAFKNTFSSPVEFVSQCYVICSNLSFYRTIICLRAKCGHDLLKSQVVWCKFTIIISLFLKERKVIILSQLSALIINMTSMWRHTFLQTSIHFYWFVLANGFICCSLSRCFFCGLRYSYCRMNNCSRWRPRWMVRFKCNLLCWRCLKKFYTFQAIACQGKIFSIESGVDRGVIWRRGYIHILTSIFTV